MSDYWKRNIFISESHAYGVLHLSSENDPSHTLCGKKSMRKDFSLDQWGIVSDPYSCCKKCDELKEGTNKFTYKSPINLY
jgi:hypothetical protein